MKELRNKKELTCLLVSEVYPSIYMSEEHPTATSKREICNELYDCSK
jgi:hypothetical protein